MGDDDAAHRLALAEQVLEIGDDVVDPQHVVLGKHQAGVDHQDVVPIFVGHHILANFPQASEGDDAELGSGCSVVFHLLLITSLRNL